MSRTWALPQLMDDLHRSVEADLHRARSAVGHPTEIGDASESVWIEVLNKHLPLRYRACKGHVVDSTGAFSQQIDVIVYDRQYSPIVFDFRGSTVVPAESVYAVFEAKQEMTSEYIGYAQEKAGSVRRLHRTSMPVPTIDGTKPPKTPPHITAGILTLSCPWSPQFGDTMRSHLEKDRLVGRLDIGCVADGGLFMFEESADEYVLEAKTKPATRFILELLARLQAVATVPMLDVRAYARHIS